jgi:hypothetical protein
MRLSNVLLVCVIAVVLMGIGAPVVTAQEPVPEAPVPTVPELYTIKGQFVRIAYNSEGWTTLGYRTANDSQGQDWLMVEVGLSLRKPTKNQTLTRERFSIKMPDGSTVPLATQKEYNGAGYLRALNARANTVRDSINYFPVEANQACAISFFSDPTKAGSISYDQFELSFRRACLGRLFFKLPDGEKIVPGQYWLYTDFAGSQVQTPFRILTKEEQKYLKKNWKDLKKQHEAFLKSEAAKAKQQ